MSWVRTKIFLTPSPNDGWRYLGSGERLLVREPDGNCGGVFGSGMSSAPELAMGLVRLAPIGRDMLGDPGVQVLTVLRFTFLNGCQYIKCRKDGPPLNSCRKFFQGVLV